MQLHIAYADQHDGLCEFIQAYYETGNCTDLTFICKGNHRVCGHKIVLCSVSPFLKKLCATIGPGDQTVVIVPDIERSTLNSLLILLYTGSVKLNGVEEVSNLKLLVDTLGVKLPDHMIQQLTMISVGVFSDTVYSSEDEDVKLITHNVSSSYNRSKSRSSKSRSDSAARQPIHSGIVGSVKNDLPQDDSSRMEPAGTNSGLPTYQVLSDNQEEPNCHVLERKSQEFMGMTNQVEDIQPGGSYYDCRVKTEPLPGCDGHSSSVWDSAGLKQLQDNIAGRQHWSSTQCLQLDSLSGEQMFKPHGTNSLHNKIEQHNRPQAHRRRITTGRSASSGTKGYTDTSTNSTRTSLNSEVDIVSVKRGFNVPDPTPDHNLGTKPNHPAENEVTCSTCGKTFTWMMINDTAESYHTCEDCSKMYELNCDVQIHTGDTPVTCLTGTEEYRFEERGGRQVPRPFGCATCGKRFITNYHLKRHVRTHTGERPYHCPSCGRRFSVKHHLSRHVFRSHNTDLSQPGTVQFGMQFRQ